MLKQFTIATVALLAAMTVAIPRTVAAPVFSPVVNTLKEAGHQGEPTIAVNPLDPSQMFMASGTPGRLLVASSLDGGTTWTWYTLGTGLSGDGFAAACCDATAAWDRLGNLFVVYVGKLQPDKQPVELLRSTTGAFGSWTLVGDLETDFPNDQPTVAVGAGSVWVTWNQDGAIVARGASVAGPGAVGPFSPAQVAVGSDLVGGVFGDVAIGPGGEVTVAYQSVDTIYANTDADGLGPAGFGTQTTISTTSVVPFHAIPAQSYRSIDAEVTLQYDRSGGPRTGRLYAVYTDTGPGGPADTDIMLRYSDDAGATWSTAIRANDDATTNSQFLPHLSLDQASGILGVTWHDSRNVARNDAAQVFATFSTDGLSVLPNVQVTTGISKMTTSAGVPVNPFQFGDYRWSAFEGGQLFVAWTDNSNSTGDNPDGAGKLADIYFNTVSSAPIPPNADRVLTNTPSVRANITTDLLVATNTGPALAASVMMTDLPPNLERGIRPADTDGCGVTTAGRLTCDLERPRRRHERELRHLAQARRLTGGRDELAGGDHHNHQPQPRQQPRGRHRVDRRSDARFDGHADAHPDGREAGHGFASGSRAADSTPARSTPQSVRSS